MRVKLNGRFSWLFKHFWIFIIINNNLKVIDFNCSVSLFLIISHLTSWSLCFLHKKTGRHTKVKHLEASVSHEGTGQTLWDLGSFTGVSTAKLVCFWGHRAGLGSDAAWWVGVMTGQPGDTWKTKEQWNGNKIPGFSPGPTSLVTSGSGWERLSVV